MVQVASLVSVSRETMPLSAQALAAWAGSSDVVRTPDDSIRRPACLGLRKHFAALRALDKPPHTPPNLGQSALLASYARSKYLLLSCLNVAPARLMPCTFRTSTMPEALVPPRITSEKPSPSSAARKSAEAP